MGGAVSLQSESGESIELTKDDSDTYLIYTAENLKEFAAIVNGTHAEVDRNNSANARLMNDIDLSSVCGPELNDGSSVSWTPIGNSESTAYTGTFDGNGNTIENLYINNTTNDYYQGLFGYVSGKVQNLTVDGTVSGSGNRVGGVVGYNSGSVINCTNTGSVSGSEYVGGVVGYNISSVTNCYNTGAVNSSGYWGGGVVGVNGGSVTNSYNTSSVKGNWYVGGVVGYNYGSVTNCYNIGDVIGSSYVGGVVGDNRVSGTVTGCYFLQTTGVNESLQGIGRDDSATGATAESVNDLSELCDKFKDVTDTWTIHSVLGRPVLNENWEGGDGSPDSPYEISTADQLKNFATAVNNGSEKSAHAKLMNNIDLKDVCGESNSWNPIGNSFSNSYSGNFDGNGKTISGLYIGTTANNQGLFGCLDQGGTVKDLTVSGSVKGGGYVGGVVGLNSGSVENCHNTGTVTGTDDYVGGVVGQNRGSVTNCYNTGTGTVTGTDDYVGGVVGYNNEGRVENCHNIGSVSGNSYVGGVVGDNSSGSVENCYNTGVVSGGEYVGGVVGYNHIGGSVTNSYNTGSVSGPDSGTGNRVGGVVGDNVSSTVENCYNTGEVSGNQVGGVVGLNGGPVENCYYQQQDPAIFGIGGTTADDTTTVAKTAEQFSSGEVAYLLQSNQTAGSSQVWGQAIGEDDFPVLSAESTKTVYRVPVDLNYKNAPENQVIYTNSTLNAKEPIREGYTFDGWYDNKACTGEAVTTITDPITTLYAKWTPNTYTVTLHTNDGTIAEGQNISSYTYGIGATLPTSVTREGYTFAGWYEKEDFTGDPVAAIGKDAMGDKTYWAKWEEVENPEPEPTPTPDPTPSGPSTGDSTGWDDIRDELENAENGDEITIDMGDETKVPAEIFESLAGKDVEISFDLGDIQWSVNGADIPTDTDFTDIDMGVTMNSDGIPVDVVNAITGEVGTVQITLAHDGEFGFTMTLTAPLGKENAGYWANLYHYDEDAEALNFEAAAKIDEDGSVTIPFSHASQYAIVIDTHSHATVDVSDIFLDIAPDAWYKDAIQYAYDNGLMTGVSATEFAPEATTTRAMIVSILARLEGVESAQAAGFADVTDEWYATAVNWAANVGVVNGYEDNTFQPNTAITREQLAAILMNYAAYKGEDVSNRADLTSYTDQPSTWAEEAMQWAVAEGLISGVTADTLQPQGAATRAQVAAILQRFLSE